MFQDPFANRPNSPLGFTLLELCLVLGIISVISVLTTPSLSALIQNTRATTLANQFIGLLRFARLQAIDHRNPVTLCHLKNNRCQAIWQDTLTVFVDRPPLGQFSRSDETILEQTLPSLQARVFWRSFRRKPYIHFTQLGQTPFQNGTFHLCPERQVIGSGRTVIINVAGRARIGAKESKYC